MQRNKKIILSAVILGIVLIFFLPSFPVPLPNKVGDHGGFMWCNGLMWIGISLKNFLLIESIGGATGFLVGSIVANTTSEERSYQGPVPEGYDEDYFRKTGITKLRDAT